MLIEQTESLDPHPVDVMAVRMAGMIEVAGQDQLAARIRAKSFLLVCQKLVAEGITPISSDELLRIKIHKLYVLHKWLFLSSGYGGAKNLAELREIKIVNGKLQPHPRGGCTGTRR